MEKRKSVVDEQNTEQRFDEWKEKRSHKRQHDKKHPRRVKKSVGAILAMIAAVLILALSIGAYIYCGQKYKTHFYSNTYINGIDFSDATISDVQYALTRECQDYTLTIKERKDETETLTGEDVDLEMVFDKDFQEIMDSQTWWKWGLSMFRSSNYTINFCLSIDEDKLNVFASRMKAVNPEHATSPVNASIIYDDAAQEYKIDPGDSGNLADIEKVIPFLCDAIMEQKTVVELEDSGCYAEQAVTANDEGLNSAVNTCNLYESAVIKIDLDGSEEVCDVSEIHGWLTINEDYSVTLSESGIEDYVSWLAGKYNTSGQAFSFVTSSGNTVTIQGGDIGRTLAQDDTAAILTEAIKTGGESSISAEWSSKGIAADGSGLGNTYVEVSITDQHVWFYKNGTLIIDSDCVTGDITKEDRSTTLGAYSLKYKQKDKVLRGKMQADGTYEYESPVDYWMPFNGGIGLHDASWRSSFGGEIYKGNGSHGCVNLPTTAAATIYENIEAGTPVIVY